MTPNNIRNRPNHSNDAKLAYTIHHNRQEHSMNHWKYIIILMIGIGMTACQSHTEQASVAPEATTTVQETTRHTEVQPVVKTPVPVARKAVKKLPDTAHAAKPTSPAPKNTARRVVSKPKPKIVSAPPRIEEPALVIKKPVPVKVDMKVLNKCTACHSLAAKAKVGPGLGKGNGIPGVFNRKAGVFPDFRNKFTKYGNGWNWDEAHLRAWLCNSKKALRQFTGNAKAKTKMPSQRICDPAKQNAVIAALRSIS
jgi:cytochrome c